MIRVARRLGIAFASFVIAWLAVSLMAVWLFGSGNVLVWVFAVIVAAATYFEALRRDRRAS
jgi:apolipoprotein N-acyltransferase